MVREEESLQEVDTLAYPPRVVICPRPAQLEGVSFLRVDAASQEDFRQPQQLLVVPMWNLRCILLIQMIIDEHIALVGQGNRGEPEDEDIEGIWSPQSQTPGGRPP